MTVQAWVKPSTSNQDSGATMVAKGDDTNWTYRQFDFGMKDDDGDGSYIYRASMSTNNGYSIDTTS